MMFSLSQARLVASQVPGQVEHEEELLGELRMKLGPEAEDGKLLYHLRSARGKVHWAVNSFLREAMSNTFAQHMFGVPMLRPSKSSKSIVGSAGCSPCSSPRCGSLPASQIRCMALQTGSSILDVVPPSPTRTQLPAAGAEAAVKQQSAEACKQTAAAPAATTLEGLPSSVLEVVLGHLGNPLDVLHAALACKLLLLAANSDTVWRELFRQRWGAWEFPVQPAALPPQSKHRTPSSTQLSRMQEQQHAGGHGETPGSPPGTASPTLAATLPDTTPDTAAPMTTPALAPRADHHLAAAAGPAAAEEAPEDCMACGSNSTDDDLSGKLPLSAFTGRASMGSSLSAFPSASSLASSHRGSSALSAALLAASSGNAATAAAASAAAAVKGAGRGGQLTWLQRYGRQVGYERSRSCPACGALGGKLVPILYGFPSPALLDGMRGKRLVLGGDHLIEDCHVWACTVCNASFRSYPYEQPQRWAGELLAGRKGHGHESDMHPTYTYEL